MSPHFRAKTKYLFVTKMFILDNEFACECKLKLGQKWRIIKKVSVKIPTAVWVDFILLYFNHFKRLRSSIISPLINGLSDHNAQLLTINNTYTVTNKVSLKQRKRLINSDTLTNFHTLPKQEMWESVYRTHNTNYMFNSFLSTFLKQIRKRMIGSHRE